MAHCNAKCTHKVSVERHGLTAILIEATEKNLLSQKKTVTSYFRVKYLSSVLYIKNSAESRTENRCASGDMLVYSRCLFRSLSRSSQQALQLLPFPVLLINPGERGNQTGLQHVPRTLASTLLARIGVVQVRIV
jgi:hypothetical protein